MYEIYTQIYSIFSENNVSFSKNIPICLHFTLKNADFSPDGTLFEELL